MTASFSLTDGANPVKGITTAHTTIYLAGLIPGTNGDSDQWQYWTGVNDNTLVETSAGHYLLTSNQPASAVPAGSTKQRGILRISGLTGYNPINQSYDFLISAPGTAVDRGKDVVSYDACKECHGFGVTIHAYSRNDVRTCVVCHSPNFSGVDMAADEADMVTMVHQIHTNKAATLGALHFSGHGENWVNLKYPGTILNCEKCHKNVAEADNWKNKPTKVACDSCHTTIVFDNVARTFVGLDGVTKSHIEIADNQFCAICHTANWMTTTHAESSSNNAALRTMESTIDNVVIDNVDGGVTVTFRVTDGGVAVTDNALFDTLTFNLAKLVPAANGASSYWQSYLSRIRTKDADKPPVLQGYNEVAAGNGTLTHLGGGVYTYEFALLNADTPGDIRTITHVHNGSSSSITGPYSAASLPTML
ncbi:MAG: hypothetical protein CO109_07030 [Deltaproteobacteria bacterium CG_4_9_14_3_um_filter_65_9]|nr:MAG: hypothetical protein CO109_07030 [Deltaproteobacteria bacterium CG_4_9_14_3_um_filter_65_9]